MLKSALFGTIAALVAVAVTFLIGDAVSGPLMATPTGGDVVEEIPIAAALMATVIGGVVGLVLAALVKRFLGGRVGVFLGITIVGLVAFAFPPFQAAENTATAVWLNVMHIAAAVPILGFLSQALRSGATDDGVAYAEPSTLGNG